MPPDPLKKPQRAHLILALVTQALYVACGIRRDEVYNILRDVSALTFSDDLDMEIAELISCECGSTAGVMNGELRCLTCGLHL